MKTFHSIVATILQQGSIVSFDSPAWTKAELCNEVEFSLEAHEYYKSYEWYQDNCVEDIDYDLTCMRG